MHSDEPVAIFPSTKQSCPPTQDWLGLGLAIPRDLKDPSPPNSQPRQKQPKFGVETHEEPVCVLLEGWKGSASRSYFKLQTMCLVQTLGLQAPLAPVPVRWGVQGRPGRREQGSGGEAWRFPEGRWVGLVWGNHWPS